MKTIIKAIAIAMVVVFLVSLASMILGLYVIASSALLSNVLLVGWVTVEILLGFVVLINGGVFVALLASFEEKDSSFEDPSICIGGTVIFFVVSIVMLVNQFFSAYAIVTFVLLTFSLIIDVVVALALLPKYLASKEAKPVEQEVVE